MPPPLCRMRATRSDAVVAGWLPLRSLPTTPPGLRRFAAALPLSPAAASGRRRAQVRRPGVPGTPRRATHDRARNDRSRALRSAGGGAAALEAPARPRLQSGGRDRPPPGQTTPKTARSSTGAPPRHGPASVTLSRLATEQCRGRLSTAATRRCSGRDTGATRRPDRRRRHHRTHPRGCSAGAQAGRRHGGNGFGPGPGHPRRLALMTPFARYWQGS